MLEHLLDVAVEVAFEGSVLLGEVCIRSKHTDELAAWRVHAGISPWPAILLALVLELGADALDGISRKTQCLLRGRSVSCRHLDAERKTDEVDEADVGEEAAILDPSQLSKAIVGGSVRIVGVDRSWLDKTRAIGSADDIELERAIGEPNSGCREISWNRGRLGASFRPERDCNVGVRQRHWNPRSGGRVVELSVWSQEHQLIVGVQASDIGLDIVAVEVVDEGQLQVRRWLAVRSERQARWRGSIDGVVVGKNQIIFGARVVDHGKCTADLE